MRPPAPVGVGPGGASLRASESRGPGQWDVTNLKEQTLSFASPVAGPGASGRRIGATPNLASQGALSGDWPSMGVKFGTRRGCVTTCLK
jgi:hypothetical protein